MNLTKSRTAKIAAGFAGFALALFFVVTPVTTQAQTTAELQAMINTLLAQIAALQAQIGGGSSGSSTTFSADLTLGSTGADVTALQQWLVSKGFLTMPAGVAMGHFGPLTQAAVAAYQTSKGISPAAGYFGPVTRASVNAGAPVVPPVVPPTGGGTTGAGLQGGAGSISTYTLISGLSSEEVGEGEEDVQVAGIEVEADNGSDIEITAVKLVFSNDATTGSSATADDNFDEYVDEVSIWFNGEAVARIDGDEFTEDNLWSKTITLDDGAVIEAGDTVDLIVAVSGVNNLDSAFATESWDVDFRTVRFVDAQGSSTSEDPSTGVRLFSFETFATAAGSELKISTGDEDINDAHILDIHATDESASQDIELMSFSLEAEGDSDLEIKKFGVNVDATGVANIDGLLAGGSTTPAIHLMIEGEEYGTASYFDTAAGAVGQDEDILFDDVDYTIAAGDSVEVLITADLLAVDTDLDVGDTVTLTLGETETDQGTLIEVEDETNENLVDADITGTATAGAHGIFDTFIDVELVSSNAVATVNDNAVDNDTGTFTMVFDVTARGGTVYVGDTSAATTTTVTLGITDGFIYRVYDSGTATTDDLADQITFTTPTGVTDSTDNIKIDEDKTSRVTMVVTQTNDSTEDDGLYYVDLAGIAWGLDDDTTYEYLYNFNLSDVKTSTIYLN